MLIFIQIFICPLALSILYSSIWRQVTTKDIHTRNSTLDLGDSDHYTETEKGKIQLLRESVDDVLVKDYQCSDDFLIRWLREYGMDVKSANKSLRHSLKWRQENQMDFILNKTQPMVKKFPKVCNIEGYDKRGGPIVYYKPSRVNFRDILLSGHSETLINHFLICSERFLQAGITQGVNGTQLSVRPGITIIDDQGAVLKQRACLRCVEFYIEAIIRNNKFYPRFTNLIVIINLPSFGKKILEMIWPFLPQYVKETTRIFGTDRQEWTKFLLTVISEDQLLQEYGGTKQSDVMRN